MYCLGIDIGSLTAKAVLIEDRRILATHIMNVKATALLSAEAVVAEVLKKCNIALDDIDSTCSTGYGRYEIPFSRINKSEISCHGIGAFWSGVGIRTIIDIGGQDCKVIVVDQYGMVSNFAMNEKCAAGTGRSLEMLSETIGVSLIDLGKLSLKSKGPLEISNKCSIFMELDVLQHLYHKRKKRDISYAINNAVAKRVVSLAKPLEIKEKVCITGGVSKNCGVVRLIEKKLNTKFSPLNHDPQLMGALGAALFAERELKECTTT